MIPARLQEILDDFAFSDGREKIELLVDYSQRMPSLPEHLAHDHQGFDEVPECMTPVFVKAEMEAGGLNFYFDVPPESPTVRGFAAILAEGLAGATPEQVLTLPNDFYSQMGLDELLTMQRMKGFSAILAHLKRIAAHMITE
jgi:cysteine desulfuration protein SufE